MAKKTFVHDRKCLHHDDAENILQMRNAALRRIEEIIDKRQSLAFIRFERVVEIIDAELEAEKHIVKMSYAFDKAFFHEDQRQAAKEMIISFNEATKESKLKWRIEQAKALLQSNGYSVVS